MATSSERSAPDTKATRAAATAGAGFDPAIRNSTSSGLPSGGSTGRKCPYPGALGASAPPTVADTLRTAVWLEEVGMRSGMGLLIALLAVVGLACGGPSTTGATGSPTPTPAIVATSP